MHSMSFHGGVVETILFNGWHTTDATGIGWSVLGIILLTSLYEGLKSYREHLFIEGAHLRRREVAKSRKYLLLSPLHILQTAIHGVQMVIGYFLMLIFMTYNVWLCLAMLIGTLVGYWLFAWEKSNGENTDCCS